MSVDSQELPTEPSVQTTGRMETNTSLDITTTFYNSSVTQGNRTFLDSEFRYMLFPVFYGIVFILGLLANCYALFILRRLRQSKTMSEIRIYMINLTMADLLFVCALPFWIGYYSRHGDWIYSDFMCRVAGLLFFINTYCSILFLAAISVNRYWAISRPLAAASTEHRCRGIIVSTLLWGVTLAMSIQYLVSPGLQVDKDNVSRCFEGYTHEEDDDKRVIATTHILIIALFFLVFLLVVICNVLIAHALLAQSPSQPAVSSCRSRGDPGASMRASRRPRGVKRQALQMLCAVLGVFVLCFLPHHVVQLPWVLAVLEIREGWGSQGWGDNTKQYLNDLHQVTLLLMGLNCILDPVVYCFATNKFRSYIKAHLRKMRKGDACSQTGTTQMSMDNKNQSQRHGEHLQLQGYTANMADES
ncbi:platelet-activating factor receptor [Osmerus mordax]|uniref:platelet-activating factor receptor n=1 Tax=Osmerus mordax TaxID=8014 RepID=UPI00350FEDE2